MDSWQPAQNLYRSTVERMAVIGGFGKAEVCFERTDKIPFSVLRR